MKPYIRLLSAAAAAVLLMATLAGCKTPAASDPVTSEKDENNISFGGKTLKIAAWDEGTIPELGKTTGGDAAYYALEQAKEKFDVEVEWIITTQEDHFSKFVQTSLAGQTYADILLTHSWNHVSQIQQGLLVPTDKYLSEAEDADKWDTLLCKIGDVCYGLSPKDSVTLPQFNLFYNRTILESLSLQDPQELALNGEWTWEKFREYCKAATDVSKNRFGVSAFGLMDVLNSTNNCATVVYDSTDKKYYNGFTHEPEAKRNLEVLEFIQTLAKDGSLMGEWVQGAEAMDDALNGFLDGQLLFQYAQDGAKLKKYDMTGFGVVTAPMGPSSDGKLYNQTASYVYWSLPKASSFSPDDRAAFWMYANTTWDSERGNAYYEFEVDEYKEDLLADQYDTAKDVQFLFDIADKCGVVKTPSLDLAVSLGALVANDIFGEVIRGNATPASAIATKDNEIQAKIDAALNTSK